MASLMLIHSKKTPREKLMSIDEACSELNVALQKALTRPVSADDFLPSFVWIMLTSKPPQLESNAAFIDSLAHPQNVTQGQSAYNFNTFQVALHYISKEMNSVSLKVSCCCFVIVKLSKSKLKLKWMQKASSDNVTKYMLANISLLRELVPWLDAARIYVQADFENQRSNIHNVLAEYFVVLGCYKSGVYAITIYSMPSVCIPHLYHSFSKVGLPLVPDFLKPCLL